MPLSDTLIEIILIGIKPLSTSYTFYKSIPGCFELGWFKIGFWMEPEEGREGIHITRKWFGQHCYFSLNILHLSLDIALHGIVVIQHALCCDSALSRL